MPLEFAKMHGAGNDFVMVDDFGGEWSRWLAGAGLDAAEGVRRLCDRRRGVGADGLIVAAPPTGRGAAAGASFRMEFRNSDGSRAAMCGNGGRCLARFAAERGHAPWGASRMETDAGMLGTETRVGGDPAAVRIELPAPTGERLSVPVDVGGGVWLFHALDTGVPHAVHFLAPGAGAEELAALDAAGVGRTVRNAPEFAPAGANVDFVRVAPGGDALEIRTYERGVEAETGACGTGAVASAVLARRLGLAKGGTIRVVPSSGLVLSVDFRDGAAPHLTGPAVIAFWGRLS